MGLPAAPTSHEDDSILQDSIEVCEMLTAPASAIVSYSLGFLGSKKAPFSLPVSKVRRATCYIFVTESHPLQVLT